LAAQVDKTNIVSHMHGAEVPERHLKGLIAPIFDPRENKQSARVTVAENHAPIWKFSSAMGSLMEKGMEKNMIFLFLKSKS
jgi:hypothetical protein